MNERRVVLGATAVTLAIAFALIGPVVLDADPQVKESSCGGGELGTETTGCNVTVKNPGHFAMTVNVSVKVMETDGEVVGRDSKVVEIAPEETVTVHVQADHKYGTYRYAHVTSVSEV